MLAHVKLTTAFAISFALADVANAAEPKPETEPCSAIGEVDDPLSPTGCSKKPESEPCSAIGEVDDPLSPTGCSKKPETEPCSAIGEVDDPLSPTGCRKPTTLQLFRAFVRARLIVLFGNVVSR